MPRTRKSVAIVCIAIVVFAAILPAVSFQFEAIFTALWLVVPAVVVIVGRRHALRCDEQPASLLSIAPSRAPPASFVFA